jgi:hypothetical protein
MYGASNLSELVTPARLTKGGLAGWKFVTEGAVLFGAPLVAFELANSKRGEMLPTLATDVGGLVSQGILTAGIMAGMSVLLPGIGTGIGAGLAATLIASGPNSLIEKGIGRSVRSFTQLSQHVRRLEMGGDYQDTESAQRQRFLGIQEMNAAVQTSRRYLGQEALLFHR